MQSSVDVGKRSRRTGRNGGHSARSEEWRNLVADVEDLIKKVANVDDQEIAEIRTRVEDTLARAKSSAGASFAAMRDRAEEAAAVMRERADEITEATDEYVHENPWAVIGVAAAVGVLIGYIAARR